MTTTALIPANEESIQVQRNELATAQLQAQAIAFEQAAFLVAQKRPRDMDLVRQKLMKECDRTSFAVTAIYRKPVGNTTVMGLSIRYAEAALNVLGNARTKRIVTLDDLTRRKILIVVSDLETNTHYEAEITIEKTVERKSLKEGQNPLGSRLNSKGERVYLVEATEDDMLTKESAIASKFIRQNALRLVPGWLQDECYDAIMETQKKKAAQDPDAEKNKLVDAFDDMGIRVDNLKTYLGLEDLSTLAPKDLIELRAIYQAIRDGETNWREVMEQRDAVRGKQESGKTTERSSTLADKLKESVAKVTGKDTEKPSNIGEVDSSPSKPAEAPRPAPESEKQPEVKSEPAEAIVEPKPEPGSGKREDSRERPHAAESLLRTRRLPRTSLPGVRVRQRLGKDG